MDFVDILQKMRGVVMKQGFEDYPVNEYQSLEASIYTHKYQLSIEHNCHLANPAYRIRLTDHRSEPVRRYSCTLEEVAQAIMSIGILSPLEPETLETLETSNQDGLGVKI